MGNKMEKHLALSLNVTFWILLFAINAFFYGVEGNWYNGLGIAICAAMIVLVIQIGKVR